LASEVLRFLYGEPPYSILDVLLGFAVPDQGLMFLLQPHNLLLALAQAVHFGLTWGLIYGLFWFVERSRRAAASGGSARLVGCLAAIILIGAALYGVAQWYSSNRGASARVPANQGSSSRPISSPFARAVCDHDEVQTYINDTYEVYQLYWPYVQKFSQAPNPMGELVENGRWYQDVFHDATNGARAIDPPPCAAAAHQHFIDGWAALSLSGFQADAGNPDLAAAEIESARSDFDAWNQWINDL
jgi:hypothetical protein